MYTAGDRTRTAILKRSCCSVRYRPSGRKPLACPTEDAAFYHGQYGLGDVNLPDFSLEDLNILYGPAAVHLTRLAREHANDLTLIALGPLTNIVAVAIALDDVFSSNIREFFWMGGCLAGPGNITPTAEFIAFADPDALQVRVYVRDIATWELALQNNIPVDEWHSMLEESDAPVAKFLYSCTELFRKRRDERSNNGLIDIGQVICDPVAILVALNEVEYSTLDQKVSVCTDQHGPMRGTTTGDMRLMPSFGLTLERKCQVCSSRTIRGLCGNTARS